MLETEIVMGNQMSDNPIGTEEKKLNVERRTNFSVPAITISTDTNVISTVSSNESTTSELKQTENNESDVINLKVFTKLSRNEYDITWSPRQGFYLPQYYTRGGSSNLLGKGAISEVYKGVDSQTKKSVAIKVVFLEKLTNINQVASSDNEVAILSKLEHNNIIRILDSGQLNMQYKYLILEHCELGCLLLNKPLSEDKSRDLFRQLLCGLSYLHSLHILHRDIKPENLLLTAKGVLKISDFSLSIECPAVGHAISESLCGSPAYWAPEIWRESTYSYQSDLYAAGLVLYEMLNGSFPWKAQDKSAEQLQKAKNSKLLFNMFLSKEAKVLLKSLLNPNPSLRITIEEVKANAWVCKSVKM